MTNAFVIYRNQLMIRNQLILIFLTILLSACGSNPAGPTISPTAAQITPTPTLSMATTTAAPPSPAPQTRESLQSATPTQPPTITISDLGTGARSISFSDKEPWLGVLLDPYEGNQPIEQAVLLIDYITGAQVRTVSNVAEHGSSSPLVFRPGSTEFVTGSSSGVTRLWDAATGRSLGDFPGPADDWASAFAFSADGKTLAGGFSKEVRIWDVASHDLLDTITPNLAPVRILSLAFAPDGETLAIGTESGALFLWDAGSKQQKVISYTKAASLAFSPDGKFLATAALGTPVVLWNTTQWTEQVLLADSTTRGAEAKLAFSQDGRSLVVGSGGDTVQVWDMDQLVKTHVLTVEADTIACLSLAPDGHTLAAGLFGRSLMLWDLRAVGAVERGEPAPTAVPDELAYVFPQPLQPGRPIALSRVIMFNELTGWGFALDGPRMSLSQTHLVHTVDGGQTWREAALPQGGEPGDFFALDANTAWSVPAFRYQMDENGGITSIDSLYTWRTSNGGKSWQQSQPFSLAPIWANGGGVNDYAVQMQFLDENNGWMLVNVNCPTARECQWQLYKTGDGGMQWQRVSESNPFEPGPNGDWPLLFSTAFWDDTSGWGAGSVLGFGIWPAAFLSTTQDEGRTWDTLPVPLPDDLPEAFNSGQVECGANHVERLNADAAAVLTECMIYKENDFPRYAFYHLTPDRGKTWNAWQSNSTESFISATTGWRLDSPGAEGPTGILQTTDAGATWTVVSSVPWFGRLNFVSDQVGWAVVSQGEARALLKTMDGGKTWEEIRSVMEN